MIKLDLVSAIKQIIIESQVTSGRDSFIWQLWPQCNGATGVGALTTCIVPFIVNGWLCTMICEGTGRV
jgi:hypothetical protein